MTEKNIKIFLVCHVLTMDFCKFHRENNQRYKNLSSINWKNNEPFMFTM